MFLYEIEKDFIAEGLTKECKIKLNQEKAENWLKTIAAFSSTVGGDLYVGVEDKSNKLIGFDYDELDVQRNIINNLVNEHIFPIPYLTFEYLSYKVRDSERYIIKVHVKESASKPVQLKYKGHKEYFKRRDGYTSNYTLEELRNDIINTSYTPYEKGTTKKAFKTSDFSKLFALYEEKNKGQKLTKKALEISGFISEDNMLSNGALLFKDDYNGILCDMSLLVFPGFSAGDNNAVTQDDFRGNIIDGIQYACKFVLKNMNRSFEKYSFSRVDYEAFPERAVFEGIVNAFVHKDYWDDGAKIEVYMYKDRLEITSPGTIYKKDDFFGRVYDISRMKSTRRNTMISEMLVKCKLMEAKGSGFDKIVDSYEEADSNHKPYVNVRPGSFTLVLPDLTYEPGIEYTDLLQIEYVIPSNPTKYDRDVLKYCAIAWRKIKDIAESVELTDSSYFRKNVIDNLVLNRLLLQKKEKNYYLYRINEEKVKIINGYNESVNNNND